MEDHCVGTRHTPPYMLLTTEDNQSHELRASSVNKLPMLLWRHDKSRHGGWKESADFQDWVLFGY